MKNLKIAIVILVLISFFACEKETLEVKDLSVGQETNNSESINAWEAPYNVTESSTPSYIVTNLQLAINYCALNNKKLILQKGKYTINALITFPSNADVDFQGSEFIRKAGSTTGSIFTMFANSDQTSGNTNITISNLLINGNMKIDNLDEGNYLHRFSGLKFSKVTNSKLYKMSVKETVNGEIQVVTPWQPFDTTNGGIFFTNNCSNINCFELDAYDNKKTGIFIYNSSSIRIYGSLTYNNVGSGISSYDAPRCEYYNIVTHDNGFEAGHIWGKVYNTGEVRHNFTGLSVNGQYSKVDGVLSYRNTGSGLVLGHEDNETTSSRYSIVSNIESYGNELEGITITNSSDVVLSNLHIYNNLRNNILIEKKSSGIQIQNGIIHGFNAINDVASGGNGIKISGGGNHNFNNLNLYDNFYNGINIDSTTAPVAFGSEVNVYNNGRVNQYRQPNDHNLWTSGLTAQNAAHIYLNGGRYFSDQPSGSITQKFGIIIQNVNKARITNVHCYGNGIQNTVKQLGTNTDIVIN